MAANITIEDENIAGRMIPTYAGITTTISNSIANATTDAAGSIAYSITPTSSSNKVGGVVSPLSSELLDKSEGKSSFDSGMIS